MRLKTGFFIFSILLCASATAQSEIEKKIQTLLDSSEIKLVIQEVDRVFDSCSLSEQAHLLHYKAAAYYKYKKYDSMLVYMDLALQSTALSDSIRNVILESRSWHYFNSNEFRLSEKDKLELIKLNPNDWTYYSNLGILYGEYEKFDACIEILDSAFKLIGANATLYINYSYFLGHSGEYQESIKYAKMGLKLDSLNDWSISALTNNQGYAYFKLGKNRKALKLINKAIEINPTNSYAYYYRSRIKLSKKDSHGSCEDLKLSYKHGPSESLANLIARECK